MLIHLIELRGYGTAKNSSYICFTYKLYTPLERAQLDESNSTHNSKSPKSELRGSGNKATKLFPKTVEYYIIQQHQMKQSLELISHTA